MGAVEAMAFGPVTIEFDRTVLRPRAWTLAQSEWAAAVGAGLPAGPVLELASGAGHIGLAVAALTGRSLVQVDASEAACGWARHNAAAAGLEERVDVRHGRFDAVLGETERFPLVIADPPYIPSSEVARFPDDPELAIDGGADGLALVRTCLQVAAAHTTSDAVVLIQVRGAAQADHLVEVQPGLDLEEVRSFGRDRAVALLRRSR